MTGTPGKPQSKRAGRLSPGLGPLAAVALAATLTAGAGWWWSGRAGTNALANDVKAADRERRFEDAIAAADRWSAARPSDGEPYYWKSRALLGLDRAQPAFEALNAAADRGFDSTRLDAIRGIMLARGGKYQQAEPLLMRALTENHGPDIEILEGLARSFLGTFQLAKAAAVLDRWKAAAPDDPRPYLWRNEIETRDGGEDPVIIGNYRAALERDPTLDDARLKLADKLRDAQKNAEARAEYRTYLDRNPGSVPALVGDGQAALQAGDFEAAARRFDEALAIDPKEPTALRELALDDLRNGRFASARDRLKTVVEVDPYNAEVRASYARALKTAGDDEESAAQTAVVERLRRDNQRISEIRAKLVNNPDDIDLKSEAARWLLDHGHDREGLEWTELILRQRPGHRETCRALAEYHARKGNPGLANYYKTAAGDGPDG